MNESGHRYFMINKPFNMVSQFVSPDDVNLLGKIDFDFPEGTHAIGRLDSQSEGLLILTTNKKVTRLLFESGIPHKRKYLVLVKEVVSPDALLLLQTGIPIRIKGDVEYITTPCDVEIVSPPQGLFAGAFEFDARRPHTWLTITLTEGKYHQVRKMVSAARHRCQRLIRLSIEDLQLGNLQPGCVHELEEDDFFTKLNLDKTSLSPVYDEA